MIPFRKIVFTALLLSFISCEKKAKLQSSSGRITQLLEKAQQNSDNVKLSQKFVDSAYTELESQKNDSLTRFLYRKTTAAYYNLGLYGKSKKSSRKIYSLSVDANDSASIARAMYYAADSYYGMAKNDSAYHFYNQAEKLYGQLNDLGTLGEIILYKAYIFYDAGEYVLCEAEAIKALRLLEKEDKTIHIYNCNNLIATALDGQNNNDEALKYFDMALRQLEKLRNEGYPEETIIYYAASCYNNMGLVYVKKNQYTDAIRLFNDALAYKDINSQYPALYAKALNNLAYAKFKAGDNSGLPQLFLKSLTLREELKNKSGIVASKIYLGEYYAAQKDTAKAINYLKQTYKEATEIKSSFDILNSLRLLSLIDKEKSSYYSGRYVKVNDSLIDNSKKNRDKFARIEYETDKLEIEKQKLAETNTQIIVVSTVALLLIAAMFMIYYLNARNKKLLLIQEQQRANEEIYQLMFDQQHKVDEARSEEKNRIAMELHDGILNNIYAVRLNLEFINKKADDESVNKRREFIRELQNVESEIRGVSHDLSRNSIFQTERSFKTLLEFMVSSQKNSDNTFFETDIAPTIEWDEYGNVVKANIYRIIQEAIQNINKYSKAKHAKVTIAENNSSIIVTATDDGVGFNPDKAKSGIGLKNLRKRAAVLGGILDIKSAKGEGTSITVVFPSI